MMGQISTTYVRLLFEFLECEGFDPVTILGEAPPSEDDLGLSRYPVARWATLLARAERHLQRPTLGLEVGQLIAPRHFGVLGYVTQYCRTLGEALLRLRALERLVYDVNPGALSFEGDQVCLRWGQAAGRPGALVDETAIAALVSYVRRLAAAPLSPTQVRFINLAPADLKPYRQFFDCPVAFAAEETVVAWPAAAMALPLRQPDPHLRDLLDQQAQRLLAQLPCGSARLAVLRQVLAQQLRDGTPTLKTAAAALHCAPRSLQRHLQVEGLQFQQVLDDLRRQLAEDHLADPRLQIGDIARLLGFSEQAAFTRAFQRWTGLSPRDWRRNHPLPAADRR